MPIPVFAPELEENKAPARETVQEAKVLQFPLGGRHGAVVGAGESPRVMLRDRLLAHGVDAVLVHGFSLYAAKILAFLMALMLVGDVQEMGQERATQLFQSLVTFGTYRAWVPCFVLFSCIYVTLSTHYFGRTFGKALFRLKVVRADSGELPDLRQSVIRYCAYGFTYASLGFTFLLGFLSAEARTVHDRVSGTVVVRV